MLQTQGETPQRLTAEAVHLFDDSTGRPRIPFPPLALPLLALLSLVAFGAIGFLGYPSDSLNGRQFYLVSHPAWLIFAWFGLIILTVQWTIFRDKDHPSIKHRKWAITITTLVCMVAEAVLYAQRDLLNGLSSTANILGTTLSKERLIWSLGNLLIVAVFVVERIVQWKSGERSMSASTVPDPESSQQGHASFLNLPLARWEMVSQDIFAGAALFFALGFVLQSAVLNFLLQPFAGRHVDTCAVSWVFGACQSGGTAGDPPTLHTIDWIVGFSGLIVSVFILVAVLSVRIFYIFRNKSTPEAVGEAVLTIVRSLAILVAVFIPNLRNIVWPILVALGTTAAGFSARLLQMYLHIQSDQHTCGGPRECPDLGEFAFFLANSLDTTSFQRRAGVFKLEILGLALLFCVIGAFCILLAARVLLLRKVKGSVWGNWLRYVLFVAVFVVCVLWMFSFMLSAFMGILQLAGATGRAPFPQLGISTAGSLLLFVIALAIFFWRRYRQGKLTWRNIGNALKDN